MTKLSLSLPFFLAFTATSLIFSGCSSKQYFEPEQTYSAPSVSSSYGSSIVDLSRDGATLKNGQYIGKKGISRITLGEGYRFLSESPSYVLAGNAEGVLKVIDKSTGEAIRAVSLHVPIVSASIQNGLIAYILNNNAFGIYKIKNNTKVVENRSERAFAIDTRAASPMFVDSLVVMPMLDGKLVVLNSRDVENTKVIYLSSEKIFNNVVYLSRMGNTMVAATPKKLISLGGTGQKEYRANISDVTISKRKIYLFTKEGEIIKLDSALNSLATKKFKYAHFSATAAFGGKVFALDQQGSLIVLSANLSKYKIYDLGNHFSKIYDLGNVVTPVFIAGTKLYKDGKVIELSKLGYE